MLRICPTTPATVCTSTHSASAPPIFEAPPAHISLSTLVWGWGCLSAVPTGGSTLRLCPRCRCRCVCLGFLTPGAVCHPRRRNALGESIPVRLPAASRGTSRYDNDVKPRPHEITTRVLTQRRPRSTFAPRYISSVVRRSLGRATAPERAKGAIVCSWTVLPRAMGASRGALLPVGIVRSGRLAPLNGPTPQRDCA